jgi:hypothetical protein
MRDHDIFKVIVIFTGNQSVTEGGVGQRPDRPGRLDISEEVKSLCDRC